MESQLAENPLAELLSEISASQLSGALRLSRGPIKTVVYFENGALIFASSNVRAHRLVNFLHRSLGTVARQVELPNNATDEEVSAIVVERGALTSQALKEIREQQVMEILRPALLWTDGIWSFDPRVRLAENVRVEISLSQLLLECARHLSNDLISARMANAGGTFTVAASNGNGELRPEEAFVLSRTDIPVTLAELQATSGLNEEDTLRAIYGLSLAGYVRRSEPRRALALGFVPFKRPAKAVSLPAGLAAVDEQPDVNELFAHLARADNYYEVLNVSRMADTEAIKNAYHELALIYHPDHFHQSAPELRARVDAAFARIAQAYETLSDESARAAYDKRLPAGKTTTAKSESPQAGGAKAEAAFKKGKIALQQNRRAEGLRFLSDAALQEPRNAKYRAAYGEALLEESGSRRLAETELQAAIALDPANSGYRVILAELYQRNGLRRRAISELERALAADPANESARALLAKLRK